MALDRFVKFTDKRPTREEVELVLCNFLGGVGSVEWAEGQRRFYVTLPGKNSFPFNGIASALAQLGQYHPDGRWIEVYIDDEQFDVITRQQDEFTNVLAKGISKMFARFWQGETEPP